MAVTEGRRDQDRPPPALLPLSQLGPAARPEGRLEPGPPPVGRAPARPLPLSQEPTSVFAPPSRPRPVPEGALPPSGGRPRPVRALVPPATVSKRSPLVAEAAVIAFLLWIYDWLQNLAPLRRPEALSHARAILSFENSLGVAPERRLDIWLSHHHALAYVASDFYDNAIFGVTLAMVAWIWWRRPDIYRPLRNELVLANITGFAVFWLYPVAPPRMLPGFIDVVEKMGGLGSWHNTLVSHADQLAAMPSMHLAWAAWCGLVAWRLASPGGWRRAALGFAVAYPVLTAVVVIATGNHFLLDVIAGTACLGGAVLVVEAGPKLLQRWRGAPG